MASSGNDARDLWARAQHGWPAGFPIAQAPNAPLLVAFGGLVAARAASGPIASAGRGVFIAGLAYWGWLEVTDGANWFRRLLGAGGLALAAGQAVAALGD